MAAIDSGTRPKFPIIGESALIYRQRPAIIYRYNKKRNAFKKKQNDRDSNSFPCSLTVDLSLRKSFCFDNYYSKHFCHAKYYISLLSKRKSKRTISCFPSENSNISLQRKKIETASSGEVVRTFLKANTPSLKCLHEPGSSLDGNFKPESLPSL